MQTFLNVLLVILVIAVIALAVLYFLGRKLEKRQVEQQQLLEMSKQTVSMLVIDKKKMKIKESGLIGQMPDARSILCLGCITAHKILHEGFHGIRNRISALGA